MARPAWQERFRNKPSRRQYTHAKIHGITPRNRSRKIRIPTYLWLVILVIGLIAGFGWFIFGSDFFRVKSIRVVGVVTPPVRATIDGLYGEHLLTYSTKGMEAELAAAQSSIKSISISKGLPDTLLIGVELRQPVIIWKTSTNTYLVDRTGTVFLDDGKTLEQSDSVLPAVIDSSGLEVATGTPIVSREFIKFVTDLDQEFTEDFPVKVDRLEIQDTTFELAMHTDTGWFVKLDTRRKVGPQLTALKEVFESFHDDIHEYVDLRVPGKAYFK